MHTMSKKTIQLSSDELDTLPRSRNPKVVLTASGEVHTNEELQVFDRDLSRFVTVQLLEEQRLLYNRLENSATDIPVSGSAVKSHGCPKRRTQLCAKRTTSYLLVFQVYPSVLGAIRRQHRRRRVCLQQVQLKSEVTNWRHESGAHHPRKPERKI